MTNAFPSYEAYTAMSVEDAATDLSNQVYAEAVRCFEAQEHSGNIFGNGHHLAQEVAMFAKNLLLKQKKSTGE